MCRIFGEFSFTGGLSAIDRFKSINSLSKRGGPDSTRFWEDTKCRMGFNRLAIIDVSENGSQPVVSPGGRFVMVFNGEVYNYKELQKKYGISDSVLRSTADKEVLSHLLELLPVESFAGVLDGMFAIAVWDRLEGVLHLIRDFAGIKSLHFGVNDKGVVFASQFNQLVLHPWFESEPVDAQVLTSYLKRHYMAAPHGLYRNTYQVLPGEVVTIKSKGGVIYTRYWEFPKFHQSTIINENQALEYISDALQKAVKDQLMADVPLGAFLSGGIDSPLVCKYAGQQLNAPLKTFTIGSDSKKHDESELALEYARVLGADSHLEKMDSAYASSILEEVMGALTEPFADFSIIPTFLVSKLARQKVTVALSGDGGDELFYGYERFWSVAKNSRYQSLPYWLKYLLYGSDKVLTRSKNINSAVLASSQGMAHQGLHSRTSTTDLSLISSRLNGNYKVVYPEYRFGVLHDIEHLVQQMRYAEFYDMMQKTLKKADSAGMANGLEIRVPFLQKSFIEASLNVDYSLSFGKNQRKELLKRLVEHHYPGVDLYKDKKGFSVPLTAWIKEDLRSQFEEVIFDRGLNDYFGFSREGLQTLMRRHVEGVEDNKWVLFTVFSLFKWQQNLQK